MKENVITSAKRRFLHVHAQLQVLRTLDQPIDYNTNIWIGYRFAKVAQMHYSNGEEIYKNQIWHRTLLHIILPTFANPCPVHIYIVVYESTTKAFMKRNVTTLHHLKSAPLFESNCEIL